ncbi:ribbon-helix-helix protein, CopG family [Vreelandella lionensis]|uniref:Ribbon-helix-helix protein, CopG family n=1 Tax=Vreelandella lionensis TaxID=1144478 RepID=A0ABW8BPB9_9GAMM
MYQDPKRVRSHKATVYLDDYELAIIQAHADYNGVPKAEIMRQMLMKEARDVLGIDLSGLTESIAQRAM